MADDQVVRINSYIRSGMRLREAVAHHSDASKRESRRVGKALDEHQPRDGRLGSECLGHHEPAEDWPCSVVASLPDFRQ